MRIRRKNKQPLDAAREAADEEALGQYVYGLCWRSLMAKQSQLDILIELAAVKQLTPVAPLRLRSWSEETDQKVKTRCESMVMEFVEAKRSLDGGNDIKIWIDED